MGVFLLNTDKPGGANLFSKRYKLSNYDEGLAVEKAVEHVVKWTDPYTDSFWYENSLKVFYRGVNESIGYYEKREEKTVLDKTGKKRLEDWMATMLKQSEENCPELTFLYKLRDLIDEAIEEKGTIIFYGD